MFFEMLYGSAVDMHSLTTIYGQHYGTSMDPIAAWAGEMNMWARPNGYDVSYLVKFDDPVELSQLSLNYDAGATVRVTSIDGTEEFGSQSCYATNGGHTNDCFVTVDAGYVAEVQVIIDSHHGTWNWMGNFIFWDTNGESLTNDWGVEETVINVETLYGSAEDMHDITSEFGGHYGTSMDPLSAWAGEMNMWASPNSYDVSFHVTFENTVTLSELSLVYDAGATVLVTSVDGLTEYGKKACYETNGDNTNDCYITIDTGYVNEVLVVIDSTHSTWNWMGDFILWDMNGNALVDSYGAEQALFTVEMVDGSASNIRPLSQSYGGHLGTSLDPIAAWAGQMNMWQTLHVVYNVIFNNPVYLSQLSLVYDAGATVKVTSGDGLTEYGREDCYETNGDNINDCYVTVETTSAVDEVRVVVDSYHSDWIWMGDYILWDKNGQALKDHYVSAEPTMMPSVSPTAPTVSPTTAPSLLPTSYPTVKPTTTSPTGVPTQQPTSPPTKAPSSTPTSYPTEKPTKIPTNVPTQQPTNPTSMPTSAPTLMPTSAPTRNSAESLMATVFSTETLIQAVLCILALVSLTISVYACCKLKKLSQLQRAWDSNYKINPGSYLPTETHKRVSTLQLSEISIGKRLEGSHQVKISLANPDEWTTLQGSRVLYPPLGDTPQGD